MPSIGAYWSAFLVGQAESFAREEAVAGASEDDPTTTTTSEIHATVRGIVRITRVEESSGQVEEESAAAAGISPQLLSDRGGPDTAEESRGVDVAVEESNEALDEVQGAMGATPTGVLGGMMETWEENYEAEARTWYGSIRAQKKERVGARWMEMQRF
jgi:hypothetical protein